MSGRSNKGDLPLSILTIARSAPAPRTPRWMANRLPVFRSSILIPSYPLRCVISPSVDLISCPSSLSVIHHRSIKISLSNCTVSLCLTAAGEANHTPTAKRFRLDLAQ